MRIESRARARALQAVYAWDMRGGETRGDETRDRNTLDRVAQRVWDDLAVGHEERQFAERLVRILLHEGKTIDTQLSDVTTNWRLSRLGTIERSVLRLGAAEMTMGGTPPRVIIKESMRLAERYGTEESARFVNGVLDAYARRLGLL